MPIVDLPHFLHTKFDYLIVGGGTCGLVVAARLSEDPNVTVGVIEAGNYHSAIQDVNVAGLAGACIAKKEFDWAFRSTPQKNVDGRVVLQPRGKGLGGSSMLNLLVHSRPSEEDLDAIETLGNKGWNWKEFLHYSKKSETLILPTDAAQARSLGAVPDVTFHGTDGPLIKSFSPWTPSLHVTMLETLKNLGVPINYEPGSGSNVGSNLGLGCIDPRDATRSYAASAYYEPNATRKNLLVLTNALASKFIMAKLPSGEVRAVGVDIVQDGEMTALRGIEKEVILAAGVFQTPAILDLSGIGNAKILSELGILPIIDNPAVGENLQDHVKSFVMFEVDPLTDGRDVLLEPGVWEAQMELYKLQKGIMASLGVPSFAYVPMSSLVKEEKIKKWHADAVKVDMSTLPSLKKQYDITRSWLVDPEQAEYELLGIPQYYYGALGTKPTPGKRYFSCVVSAMHPFSRGSVHITSTNPADPPVIDPNYFSNPVDLEMLTEAVKFALRMFETEPLRGKTVVSVSPTQEEIQRGDEGIVQYVKRTAGTAFHPLGSASMLPRSEGGVVDVDLKVYGTSNLRVVDMSIVPIEPACHPQSVAYAIGEKGADIIKGAAASA